MFQKGHPKYGGRQKGTVNLHKKCEDMGLDVFLRMLELAKQEEDPEKQFHKLDRLAQYLYAKPKETEVQLTPEQVREFIRQWTEDVQSTGS